MELEIRDTQSGEVRTIAESGATMGRQGSSAEFIVPDRTVSSKHARVFVQDGKWFLEDLRSSNGTFVNGERLTGPKQLTVGDRFALCRYGFEVVNIAGVDATNSTAMLKNASLQDLPGEATDAQASDPFAVTAENPPGGLAKSEGPTHDLGPRDKSANLRLPAESSFGHTAPAAAAQRSMASLSGATRPPAAQGGVVARALAVAPEAFAYYLGAAPALLVNPIAFVRRGIAAPRFGALGLPELIGWALPANLVSAGLGIIATLVFQLIWGSLSFGLLVGPLVTLAIFIAAAVVTGWIWHPLLRWFVRLLKGESDEVSRSNMFVMVETGLILSGVGGALAVFVSVIPIPFVGMMPLLITLATSLILTWIAYSWYRHFSVVAWFPIVLLVLGALSCLTTAKGLIDVVRADIARLGSGGDAVDIAAATARINQLGVEVRDAAARGDNDKVKELAQEMEELQASVAAASAAQAAVAATGETTAALDPTPPATAAPGPAAPAGVTPAAILPVPAKPAGVAPVAGAPPVTSPAAVEPAAGLTRYEEFLRRRDAVELALDKDPTLLKRKGLEPAYREMLKVTAKIKQKYKVKPSKKQTPEKIAAQKVAEKLRDAEIFEQTTGLVDQLYEKLGSP